MTTRLTKTLAVFLAAAVLGGCGPDLIQRTIAKEELNKKVVLEFYQQAINEKNYDAAARHLGSPYVQHNPTVADGAEGLRVFIEETLKKRSPEWRAEIKRVFADGDHVILHVHALPQPGARGVAVVDIFRLLDGKIVEHWGVIQDVPEKIANPNGMF